MINKRELLYILLSSILLAVFAVPTIFLGQIILYKFNILPFIYCGLMGILYALMIKDDKLARVFIKWGISLPISYLLFQYFWETNYSIRALNWVFEGYGKQSAGGNFAFLVYLGTFCFFYVSSILCICLIKVSNYNQYKKFQICVGSVIGIMVVAVTLILESMFPTYSSIIYTG